MEGGKNCMTCFVICTLNPLLGLSYWGE